MGNGVPHGHAASVRAACVELEKAKLPCRLMVDFSHANAAKVFKRQLEVAGDVARQIEGGERCVIGAMVESNLVEGRQDLVEGAPLCYGQSVTDGCLGWDDSVRLLDELAGAVKRRRGKPKR